MYTSTILAVLAACLASAAPTPKYYGIGITFITTPPGQTPVEEPSPIEINKLTNVNMVSASEIKFDLSTAVNVDIDTVECRAYKDEAGIEPGSAPFNSTSPAYLSTNLVEVGSVLCYIVETS